MILAIEDSVSESVLRKLVLVTRPDLAINVSIGNRGKAYLRSRAPELNRTARSLPVFMMVDLDTPAACPPEIRDAWFGQLQRNMLFRIAVIEVESWILADRTRCAAFLGVPVNRIPANTDSIATPKEFLVNLARRSRRRDIRADLVPDAGATIPIGPAYNARLMEFVDGHWQPTEAAAASDSLRRALQRLATAFQ